MPKFPSRLPPRLRRRLRLRLVLPVVASTFALAFVYVGCAEGPVDETPPEAPKLVNEEGEPLAEVVAATGRWTPFFLEFGELASAEIDGDDWDLRVIDGGFEVRPNYLDAGDDDAQARLLFSVEVDSESEPIDVDVPIFRATLRWEQLSSGAGLPPGREYFAWWPDPLSPDRAWLMGGFHYAPAQFTPANDLWSMDLATDTWTDHGTTSALAAGGANIATASTGESFRFGGMTRVDGDFEMPFTLAEFDAEALDFSSVAPTGAPSTGFYQSAFFWADALSAFVVVGGLRPDGSSDLAVSVFDPAANTFSSLDIVGDASLPAPIPVPRGGFSWVFSQEQQRFFLFGGDAGGASSGCNCLNDTWSLDVKQSPPAWTFHSTDTIPEERRNAAYGLDAKGQRMFVFGGTPNGAVTAQGVWALDLASGDEDWTRIGSLEGEGAPAARTSGGFFYDARRDRMLMGFGNNGQGVQTNLWSLSLSHR